MEENINISQTQLKQIERAEHETQVELRRQELEREFKPSGWKTVRKELFAHMRDPQITIRPDSVTFNASCIGGLEGVVYIHFLINDELRRIAIEPCEEDDKDALRWCIQKEDKRKSRKMTCRPFADGLYRLMDWNKKKYYKILGYKIEFEGRYLYVFDLTVAEILDMPTKKGSKEDIAVTYDENELSGSAADDSTKMDSETATSKTSRSGEYPDDVISSFGIPMEEHKRESEYTEMNGYVNVGLLNGRNTGGGK